MHTRTLLLLCIPLWVSMNAHAQHTHDPIGERAIEFPDVPGYQTLVCDFHLHTVFSDGFVWPSIRVQEAVRDGLDCIAVTDHLEYLPHRADIPLPDHNRSYEIAVQYANDRKEAIDLIILRGSEITRGLPPGHVNAIFIQDANRLLLDDVLDVLQEAKEQGAFLFWNHPNWWAQQPDGMAALTDLHREMIEEGLLHGIEIANEGTYSSEALQIALDNDLTMLGTSDIHGLVDWTFDVPHGGHRPVTLVFARERSTSGIREALDAGRTVVWYENDLVGKEEHLVPLIDASISVSSARYEPNTSVLEVTLENSSDATFLLFNWGDLTFHDATNLITAAPRTTTFFVKTIEQVPHVDLEFLVANASSKPGEPLEWTLRVYVDEDEVAE